jgi:DNA-binding response OmpR family regulator
LPHSALPTNPSLAYPWKRLDDFGWILNRARKTEEGGRELLERAGFGVREAPDGERALKAAHADPPHLVVLDVCLPGIGGYEVLRELQETVDPDISVVLVSGIRTDTTDRVSGLLLGADDYLVKPFEPDELLARIRRSLARSRHSDRRTTVSAARRPHRT